MMMRVVRGVFIVCGVSAVILAMPQESRACGNWGCTGSCNACSTYAPPYVTAYPFGGFFASLFGGGPNRCCAPACEPCAPVCSPCAATYGVGYSWRANYRPMSGPVPVTNWMRQVSYAPYVCRPVCGVPCSPCVSTCSPCATCGEGVAIAAPAAGCGCGVPASPAPQSLAPTPVPMTPLGAPTTFAPSPAPVPSTPATPSTGAPTPVPTLPPGTQVPSIPAPNAAPATAPTSLESVTPQPLSGPINAPAGLPRYTAPQPIPSASPSGSVAPIPLPRLPSMERTTALPMPTNIYLISSRPALPVAPVASPAVLDNDGWQPSHN
jgi:hypothetical protein